MGDRPRHGVAHLGIGRTFQNLALYHSMSVLGNVIAGTHCRGRAGFLADVLRLPRVAREERALAKRAHDLLATLELTDVARAPVASLPFATRKRVELAGLSPASPACSSSTSPPAA